MNTHDGFLDDLARGIVSDRGLLTLPWPIPGVPDGGLRSFATIDEGKACLLDLCLSASAPLIVVAKYHRAQKVFLTAWLDPDLIKAGEPVAFTALELALNDCYGHIVQLKRRRKSNGLPFSRQ